MSYVKAMKFARNPRKGKAQYMGFGLLGQNERRRIPWLGSSWYEEGREEERKQYIKEWQEETEKMLKANPNLKIVD